MPGIPKVTTEIDPQTATPKVETAKPKVVEKGPYDDFLMAAAEKYNVPLDMLKAMMMQESGGDSTAESSKGARGLLQLMPGTAKDMGVTDPLDPQQNIDGGAKYYRQMLDRYEGDERLALAAYNSGFGNVDKYGGIPPFKETQDYVSRIMDSLGREQQPGKQTETTESDPASQFTGLFTPRGEFSEKFGSPFAKNILSQMEAIRIQKKQRYNHKLSELRRMVEFRQDYEQKLRDFFTYKPPFDLFDDFEPGPTPSAVDQVPGVKTSQRQFLRDRRDSSPGAGPLHFKYGLDPLADPIPVEERQLTDILDVLNAIAGSTRTKVGTVPMTQLIHENGTRFVAGLAAFPFNLGLDVWQRISDVTFEGMAEDESFDPFSLPGTEWEERIAAGAWEAAKITGETALGLLEFTLQELANVLIGFNPIRSDDDPEKIAAKERFWDSGGLGAYFGWKMMKHGTQLSARGIQGGINYLGKRALIRSVGTMKANLAPPYTGIEFEKFEQARLPAPAERLLLEWDGPYLDPPIGTAGRPIILDQTFFLEHVPIPPKGTGPALRGGTLSTVVPPLKPREDPMLIRWIKQIPESMIEEFTDGEARTELRRYLVQIVKEHPRMAEKFIARLKIERVKELLLKANKRHKGLPAIETVEKGDLGPQMGEEPGTSLIDAVEEHNKKGLPRGRDFRSQEQDDAEVGTPATTPTKPTAPTPIAPGEVFDAHLVQVYASGVGKVITMKGVKSKQGAPHVRIAFAQQGISDVELAQLIGGDLMLKVKRIRTLNPSPATQYGRSRFTVWTEDIRTALAVRDILGGELLAGRPGSRLMRLQKEAEEVVEEAEEAPEPGPADNFMEEFDALEKNPLNDNVLPKQRIINDTKVELNEFQGIIRLQSIQALDPGKGNASKAIETLKALADKHGVILQGIAKPIDDVVGGKKAGLTKEQLIAFYERHGFVRVEPPAGIKRDDFIEYRPEGVVPATRLRTKITGLERKEPVKGADIPESERRTTSFVANAIGILTDDGLKPGIPVEKFNASGLDKIIQDHNDITFDGTAEQVIAGFKKLGVTLRPDQIIETHRRLDRTPTPAQQMQMQVLREKRSGNIGQNERDKVDAEIRALNTKVLGAGPFGVIPINEARTAFDVLDGGKKTGMTISFDPTRSTLGSQSWTLLEQGEGITQVELSHGTFEDMQQVAEEILKGKADVIRLQEAAGNTDQAFDMIKVRLRIKPFTTMNVLAKLAGITRDQARVLAKRARFEIRAEKAESPDSPADDAPSVVEALPLDEEAGILLHKIMNNKINAAGQKRFDELLEQGVTPKLPVLRSAKKIAAPKRSPQEKAIFEMEDSLDETLDDGEIQRLRDIADLYSWSPETYELTLREVLDHLEKNPNMKRIPDEVLPEAARATIAIARKSVQADLKRQEAANQEVPQSQTERELLETEAQTLESEMSAEQDAATTAQDIAPETTGKGKVLFAKRFELDLKEINLDPGRFQPREADFAQETFDAMEADFVAGDWEPAAMDDLIIWRDPKNNNWYSLNHSRTAWLRHRSKAGTKIGKIPVREFTGTEAEAMRFAREKSNRLATPPTLIEDVRSYREAVNAGATQKELKVTFRGQAAFLEEMMSLNPDGKFMEVLNQPLREGVPFIKNFARWVAQARRRYDHLTDRHENEIFEFLYQREGAKNYEMSKDKFNNMLDIKLGDMEFDPRSPLGLKRKTVEGLAGRSDTGGIVREIARLQQAIKDAVTKEEIAELTTELNSQREGLKELARTQTDIFDEESQSDYDELIGPDKGVELSGGFAPVQWFLKMFGERGERLNSYLNDAVARKSAEGEPVNRQTPLEEEAFGKDVAEGKESEADAKTGKPPGVFKRNLMRIKTRAKGPGLASFFLHPRYVLSGIPDMDPVIYRIKMGDEIFHAILPKNQRRGPLAAAIWQKINMTERQQMIDINQGNFMVGNIIKLIHKADYGRRGEIFAKMFDGKDIQEILDDPKLHPTTKSAALLLKRWLDKWKKTVYTELRSRIRPSVTREVEKAYRKRNFLQHRKMTSDHRHEISMLVEDRLRKEYPDTWGLSRYLPHILPGEFTLMKLEQVIGSSFTVNEGLRKAADWVADHPTEDFSGMSLEFRQFIDQDIVRLTTSKRWAFNDELAKVLEGISAEEIAKLSKGIIGDRAYKDKYNQFLKKRMGAEGWNEEMPFILNMYNWQMNRWLHQSRLNRAIAGPMEKLKRMNPALAEYVDEVFKKGWGVRYRSTQRLDEFIRELPNWASDNFAPYALDRWTGAVKTFFHWGLLKTNVGFMLGLNNIQLAQTLLPLMRIRDMPQFFQGLRAKGGKWAFTREDWKILEKHGVNDLLRRGGKFGHENWRFKFAKNPAKPKVDKAKKAGLFASETSNQQGAFLIMYRLARKMGLSDTKAATFAHMRGNLYTQFLAMRTDVPEFLSGPITSTVFMYQRFGIGAIEIGMNELRNGRIKPAAKFIGIQVVLGGARTTLKWGPLAGVLWALHNLYDERVPTSGYLSKEAYVAMKKWKGEDAANFMMYGLPGLMAWDWSYRMQIGDLPYGSSPGEMLGNKLLGIPGSFVWDMMKAGMDTKGTSGAGVWERMARRGADRLAPGRPIEAMRSFTEQTDIGLKDIVFSPGESVQKFIEENQGEHNMRGWVNMLGQLMDAVDRGQYKIRDHAGRVRFETDLWGLLSYSLSNRPIEAGKEDMLVQSISQIVADRDGALDEGVRQIIRGGAPDFQRIHRYNALYPEFAILPDMVWGRYDFRMKNIDKTASERMLERSAKDLKDEKDRIRWELFGTEPPNELK